MEQIQADYQIAANLCTGDEPIIGTDKTLIDYWRWAHSCVASNSERGKLAEFYVKCAVGAAAPFRIEWDAVDVVAPEGTRIEVKSSAYLQTWKCKKLSKIIFDIAPKMSWNSETNLYNEKIGRSSDLYVFCLFACQNPHIANPLDLSQWEFYLLSTKVLNARAPTQKTISLSSLIGLGARKVSYCALSSEIKKLQSEEIQ